MKTPILFTVKILIFCSLFSCNQQENDFDARPVLLPINFEIANQEPINEILEGCDIGWNMHISGSHLPGNDTIPGFYNTLITFSPRRNINDQSFHRSQFGLIFYGEGINIEALQLPFREQLIQTVQGFSLDRIHKVSPFIHIYLDGVVFQNIRQSTKRVNGIIRPEIIGLDSNAKINMTVEMPEPQKGCIHEEDNILDIAVSYQGYLYNEALTDSVYVNNSFYKVILF